MLYEFKKNVLTPYILKGDVECLCFGDGGLLL